MALSVTHAFVATGSETAGAAAAGKVVTSEWNAAHVVTGSAVTLADLAALGVLITSPLDIPNCALWLDASQLTLADNDPVATWPDLSGNGYDAAQATSANRPTCKTMVINGLRVVRFDTTGGDAGGPQYLGLSGGGLDLFRNISQLTIACVFSGVTNNADYILNASMAGTTAERRVQFEVPSSFPTTTIDCEFSTDAAFGGNDGASIVSTAQPCAAIFSADTIARGIAIDSTTRIVPSSDSVFYGDSSKAFPDTASQAILIGAHSDGTSGLTGDIGELIVWQRALNASERRNVLEYLSAKWGTL